MQQKRYLLELEVCSLKSGLGLDVVLVFGLGAVE